MERASAELVVGRESRAAFRFIFASALMSAISFSIVIPILPNLVREIAGGDTASAAEWMMVFASAWGLAQFLCAPLLGALSDRFGRRPVLLISTFGLGVDFLFMALAPTLPLLLVGRMVSGATAASFATAHAYVADIVAKEDRAAFFGRLASSISLGYLIGPVLGGWLGEIDLRLPYAAAASVTLANWLYGFFVLPESLAPERRSGRLELRSPIKAGGLALLRSRPLLARLAGISFLNSLANMLWGSVWVLFCAHRFGWSPLEMGIAILASGVAGVGVQAWGVGRVVKAAGERNTLLIGAGVACATLAFTAFAPNGWWYAAIIPVAAFGLLLGPGLQGMVSASVGPEEQGRAQGGLQGLNGIATIVGPPIYGMVFAWSLRQPGGTDLSGLALLLSAAFMAGAFVLALGLGRQAPRSTAARTPPARADRTKI
ncbi:MAG TPA: MFS transporter [Allosphingosinicella sp.]|jgi:DHA1 family tetracycline resistance protein-like MFS transporter